MECVKTCVLNNLLKRVFKHAFEHVLGIVWKPVLNFLFLNVRVVSIVFKHEIQALF
jgi:hypothetical protein